VSTQRTGALVWITQILVALVLPSSLLEVTHLVFWGGSIRTPQPGQDSMLDNLLRFILEAFVMYSFRLWAAGKVVCAGLAILTIAVALQRGVEPRIRALTVGAGSVTCCLLLWWINLTRH
jgi:hypothetical protein